MNRKIVTLVAIVAGLAATACAPTTRFEWGAYEQALYSYSQNAENRTVYKLALERAIEQGRTRNAVAPGLLAELGYLHLQDGNTDEALRYFREERTRFPESAVFMDQLIARLGGATVNAAGAK